MKIAKNRKKKKWFGWTNLGTVWFNEPKWVYRWAFHTKIIPRLIKVNFTYVFCKGHYGHCEIQIKNRLKSGWGGGGANRGGGVILPPPTPQLVFP